MLEFPQFWKKLKCSRSNSEIIEITEAHNAPIFEIQYFQPRDAVHKLKSLSEHNSLSEIASITRENHNKGGLEDVKKIFIGEACEFYFSKIAVYKVKMLAGAAAK